jgi:hypothetical protein
MSTQCMQTSVNGNHTESDSDKTGKVRDFRRSRFEMFAFRTAAD